MTITSQMPYIYTCVCACIYIYCHTETVYFVVSPLFRCFKQGSKRGWLYISRISYPRTIVNLSLVKAFFTYKICYRLPRVLNSWEKQLRFSLCSSQQIFPLECSTNRGKYIYIYIYACVCVSSLYIYSVYFSKKSLLIQVWLTTSRNFLFPWIYYVFFSSFLVSFFISVSVSIW